VGNSLTSRIGDGFDGIIDEVKIFNYARTASQIDNDAD